MGFHENLKSKMHLYAKQIYKITKQFPRDEIFGITT
jgi:hypothetical protein